MRGGHTSPKIEEVVSMDIEFVVSAEEAAVTGRLQVSIAGDQVALMGLASGREVRFEGLCGNITVKVLPVQEQPVSPVLPEVSVEQPAAQAVSQEVKADQPDQQLFERLVALRKQISKEVKLPPFIIFHDSTLRDMCRRLPADLEAMGTVSGVGEAKLKSYGSRFLEVIREYLKTQGKEG
jgi:hypothetical protein